MPSHAIIKSLLFLGTGSVLHATGERNLGRLGGLILQMPHVAILVLIGTLAIAGVPLLNGFVAEWLLLQAFLFSPKLPTPYLTMLIPVVAALFVLTMGLAAYVMVKFYGIIFLGKPRESNLSHENKGNIWEHLGLGWLAICCIVFGLFPSLILNPIMALVASLVKIPSSLLNNESSWLLLAPVSISKASYSPILLLSSIVVVFILIYAIIRWLYHGKVRRSFPWDGGFSLQTSRMQDTAEGFGQPIKTLFAPFLQIQLEVPSASDQQPHYHMHSQDRFWHVLYIPMVRGIMWCARMVSKLQQGRISLYLLYSFLTLLILLGVVL